MTTTPDFASMRGQELIDAVNALRHQWDDIEGRRRYADIERRGSRYCVSGMSLSSMKREEIVEQCYRLHTGMADHIADCAEKALRARIPNATYEADVEDREHYCDLLHGIRRLPRDLRMQALAFNGCDE